MYAQKLKKGHLRDLSALILAAALVSTLLMLPGHIQAAIQFDATGYAVGASSAAIRAIVSADLDQDGDLDLVTGNQAGEITAWENDGGPFDGPWSPHAVGTTAPNGLHLAVADFDHDGWVDLVSGDGAGQIRVWRNDGTPFIGAWPSNLVANVTGEAVVLASDLDSDSWMDIACVGIAYGGPGDVTIWRNDGTPFDDAWIGLTLYSGYTLSGVAVADLDLDGNQDIIFTHDEYYATALRNDGTPFVGGWTSGYVGFAGYGMVTGLATGDFDSDGYPDLATACGYLPTQPQWVWRNDHTPFDGEWMSNVYGSTPAPTVVAADLDLDSRVDLVTGSHAGEDFEVIAWGNDGTPFSGWWLQVDVGSTGTAGVPSVALADLDVDGDLDIISGSGPEADFEIMAWRNNEMTAVELSGFTATAGDRTVTLSWKTRSELDNLGFEVYRRVQDGPFVKINAEMIPGAGTSETGGSYQYVDRGLTNGTTYCYQIASVDFSGIVHMYDQVVFATPTGMLPLTFALSQNYPNPFNPSTEITYAIPEDQHVTIKVYNILGAEVATLVDADQEADRYTVSWNAEGLASGVYFCQLEAGDFHKSIKMVLLK